MIDILLDTVLLAGSFFYIFINVFSDNISIDKF